MYLAKVSFNNNNWKKPSGLYGKCKSFFKGIYFEWQNGFAWEEWNFSKSRILEDGYQYGFLQAVHNDDNLRNKSFKDVVLFTTVCTEGENPKYYILGHIQELETLSYNMSRIAREKLGENGVLVKMGNDVTEINGNKKTFDDNLNSCINIRYKKEHIKLLWGKVDSSILQINLNGNFSFKEIFETTKKTDEKIINVIEKFTNEHKKLRS
jgi:hypothetical protein